MHDAPAHIKRLALSGLLLVLLLPGLTACDRGEVQASEHEAEGEPVAQPEPSGPTDELVPDPPGAPPFSAELRERLAAQVRERHPEQAPRTRHLRADGAPIYTNRLAFESSPYLLQHAHNPVNWYPWGDEAFELAASLDRPVFLSVGYSTCHWCHVMEEESFEDVEIATFINANFVPIKVDREQRPDVDEVYMTAVQAISGRGGWPMTVVMTPDRRPFFGATYIPPRDGVRGSRMGLLTLLGRLRDLYRDDPEQALANADSVSARLAAQARTAPPGDLPGVEVIERAVTWYVDRFDERHGGIGGAPKFPQPSRLGLLLRADRRQDDLRPLEVAVRTLSAMAAGGIYDHIGGGFHRYATDAEWLVPHFEKMLYDNAQLAGVYLEAYSATNIGDFARVARETLDYVAREMTSPEGGFYSATDADSEGEEGLFFVWERAQIEALLAPDEAELLMSYYGVSEAGNFEGRNILHVERPLVEVATELGLEPDAARATLERARQTLYDARRERIPPLLDDKVLTGWNGLMIGAFAQGALVLGESSYAERAERAAAFIEAQLWQEGRLLRSYRSGRAELMGYLDDYAFFVAGLLDLYEATGTPRWLELAIAVQRSLDEHHLDTTRGAYFFTANDAEELLVRQRPEFDGALPSGNSVAAANLLRLGELTMQPEYTERADQLFRALAAPLQRAPQGMPRLLQALDFRLDRVREIVLVEPRDGGDVAPFIEQLSASYLPNRVLVRTRQGAELEALQRLVPLVELKVALDGNVTAYVCEAGVCERPTTDPAVFATQIQPILPYEALSD